MLFSQSNHNRPAFGRCCDSLGKSMWDLGMSSLKLQLRNGTPARLIVNPHVISTIMAFGHDRWDPMGIEYQPLLIRMNSDFCAIDSWILIQIHGGEAKLLSHGFG